MPQVNSTGFLLPSCFTFQPSPGMESRPDRIIVSSSLTVKSVELQGNGVRYKQKYTAAIHWERFITIIKAARLSYLGVSGYSCYHDCGPSGSCQCGVCVAVGNKQNCDLPNCDTCNADIYYTIVTHSIIFMFILFHLFHAVILVLTIGAGSYGNTMYSIFGFNCCLFNPDLCRKTVRTFQRKNRCMRFLNIWPIFRLPPYIQLFLSAVVLVMFCFYVHRKLDAIINLTYNALDEEFFPSDHLMLTADIM